MLVQLWLELSTLHLITPTIDEPIHIVRGYAFAARGDDRLRLRGPILSNVLSGWSLLLEPQLQFPPQDDPIWLDEGGADLSMQFMWGNAVPADRIIFLARLPIIFVSLLLTVFVYRWAADRTMPLAALGAAALAAFCPNLLANARLATTDLVTAATFLIAAFAFDRALRRPTLAHRLFSGVAFGLALAAKFSAFALPLAFGLQVVVQVWRARRQRAALGRELLTLLVTAGVGALMVWALYGFKLAPVVAGGLPLPAPSYWDELRWMSDYLQGDVLPGYLFGQIAARGWWYYYPVAFLLKTPIPVLILALLALGWLVIKRDWVRTLLPILLVPGLVMGPLLFSPHDIGYRYLLPMLPFIYVASADVLAWLWPKRAARLVIGGLLAWQVAGTALIYPYYLAYFNELAGGPERGRFLLADSNLDWGQDLIGLRPYIDAKPETPLKLAYNGRAPASAYGLKVQPLPIVFENLQDQGPWWLHTYYPPDPGPGEYAISAQVLAMGHMYDPSAYAFFRSLTPTGNIGYSIYMYSIAPRGEPIGLALSGVQVDQIDPPTYQHFATNDVRLRWFDATSSVIAAPDRWWVAIMDSQSIASELASLWDGIQPVGHALTTLEKQPYQLYKFDLYSRVRQQAQAASHMAAVAAQLYPASPKNVALPVKYGHSAELIGYRLLTDRSGEVRLVTYWQALAPSTVPLQLFVHAIQSDGQIIAQEDRLAVSAYGWRAGDLFAQVNQLHLPAEVAGKVWLQLGLYNPDTGARLPVIANGVEVDQRLLLAPIDLK
ncbi:MAG: glycosyltransferase family 39 protein [Chloroflexi bacterium]|nr:glycosyltransferase family 39 protein [Chloroflexota bacterium]